MWQWIILYNTDCSHPAQCVIITFVQKIKQKNKNNQIFLLRQIHTSLTPNCPVCSECWHKQTCTRSVCALNQPDQTFSLTDGMWQNKNGKYPRVVSSFQQLVYRTLRLRSKRSSAAWRHWTVGTIGLTDKELGGTHNGERLCSVGIFCGLDWNIRARRNRYYGYSVTDVSPLWLV